MENPSQPHRVHHPAESVILHLLPGVLIAGIGGLAAWLLRDFAVPAYFILEVSVLTVMIPTMLTVMVIGRRREGAAHIRDLITRSERRLSWWEYLVYPVVIVGFAGAVFSTIGDPVNEFFRGLLVPNLPGWADLTDVFVNPEAYAATWPIVCWALGAVLVTFVGPIAEECYFRGYLLPRIPGPPVTVILSAALLFALYHVFTIWMAPVRFVALIPLVFLVWKTRSVTIGIIGHCLLNLVGDTIGMIPVVFG